MQAISARLVLILGLLGATFVIAYGAIQLIPSRPSQTAQVAPVEQPAIVTSGVVVAARVIGRGQRIQREDLALLPVDGKATDGSFVNFDDVIGKTAIQPIANGQMVLAAVISADPSKAGLAALVPPGSRAIELRTNEEIAVGNFVRPGDHVDIAFLLPEGALPKTDGTAGSLAEARTLLQNIPVLAVGDTLGDPASAPDANGRRPEPPHSVTVSMTPDQVSQFVLARSLGSLYLTLRNPSDPQVVTATTAHLADLRGSTPGPAMAVSLGRRPIELITGNHSQTIYSNAPAAAGQSSAAPGQP